MDTLQKWLAGLIGIGAIVAVGSNGKGIATVLGAGQRFISGTERTAITGKA
jgi:hypothetical protein